MASASIRLRCAALRAVYLPPPPPCRHQHSLLLLDVAFLQVCLPVVCLARELAPVTRLALTLPARTRRLSSPPPPPPPCCFSPPPALFLLFPGPGRPTGLPTSDSVAHGLASRAGFLHQAPLHRRHNAAYHHRHPARQDPPPITATLPACPVAGPCSVSPDSSILLSSGPVLISRRPCDLCYVVTVSF